MNKFIIYRIDNQFDGNFDVYLLPVIWHTYDSTGKQDEVIDKQGIRDIIGRCAFGRQVYNRSKQSWPKSRLRSGRPLELAALKAAFRRC